jgi:hypothetical protein
MNAKRRSSRVIPTPAKKTRWFVGVNPSGADVAEIPCKRAFQSAILVAAEKGAVANLHYTQVAVAGKFLIESRTPVTVNTTIHFVLDQRTQILIPIGPLHPKISSDPVPARNRHVLEQTVAPFIANRAIMGVVKHEPFNHVLTKIHCLFVGGRYYHAILSIDHAAHLHALEGAFQKLHGADPAGAHRSQGGMVAEARNHDAQSFRGLNHLCSRWNFYFPIIYDEFRHVSRRRFTYAIM